MMLRRWIAVHACRFAGMEAHYPPRPEPDHEPASTHAVDGSPCRGWPGPSETRLYLRPKA